MSAYERAEARTADRAKASAGRDANDDARSIEVTTSPATLLRRVAAGLLEPDEVEAWLAGVQKTANWLGNVCLEILHDVGEIDPEDPPEQVISLFHTLATTIGQENVQGLLWAEELRVPGPGEVVRHPPADYPVVAAPGPCEGCREAITPGQLWKPGPLHLGCPPRPAHGGYPEPS